MLESLALGVKELASESFGSKSFDLPKFSSDIESSSIVRFEDADKPLYIICRNESLEGGVHPITGVKFENKVVELPNGDKVEGVFPEFDAPYEVRLDESIFEESDRKQFESANESLKEAVENNEELRSEFTEEQIEQILEGETPEGYTWHHSEEPGLLQLVDSETHAKTGHTGGKVIWGGGSENR